MQRVCLIPFVILLGAGIGSSAAQSSKKLTLKRLFPRDRVLDVQITVPETDWDTIRNQKRDFFSALQGKRKYGPVERPYTYVVATVSIDGVIFPRVGLRKKGFIGSQSSARPSLKIKLDHVNPGTGIEGLVSLTFNNNRQDPSLVSQFLGYTIFRAAGSPAPRCAFAKVTVNGRNLGVYSHVESARQPLAKRSFGTDAGTLYEGTVVDFFPGWERSFENKFGDDAPGREKIVQLAKALQGESGEAILDGEARGRAWVPTSGKHARKWTALAFDDAPWREGRNGAGYERDEGYQSLISTGFDLREQMDGKSASVYLRFPFEIDDLGSIRSRGDLVLRMKYDDGFVAYLNGHQIASANAPQSPQWDSKATHANDDGAAMSFANIDVSQHASRLRKGRNVLAIHGLNVDLRSSDMLIVAELRTRPKHDIEKAIAELVDLDAFYRFWAIESLLGFWDGYTGNANNYFVYLNPKTHKFHFLPWGADCLFEKFSRLGRDPRAPVSVKTKGLIAHHLYQQTSGRKRYAKTLKRILARHWKEKALLAEIDRIDVLLKPHRTKRQEWSSSSALDKTREFIRTRRADILAEIKGGMPVWTRSPGQPPLLGGDPGPPADPGKKEKKPDPDRSR